MSHQTALAPANAITKQCVSIFVHDFAATGVVRNAVAIANACAAEGIDVELAATSGAGPFRAMVRDDVPVIPLLSDLWAGRLKARPLQLTAALARLTRYLRRRQPNVLLSAGNHAHLAAIIAHRASGRPGALVCRFSNDVERPHACGFGGLTSHIIQSLGVRFLRLVAMQADRVIVVSEELAERFSRYAPTSAPKVSVIRNGVDLSTVRTKAAAPLEHPWFQDQTVPVLVGMGRLKAQKNFEQLIRAVGLVNRVRPVRLAILGSGTPAAERRLQSLAEREGIAESFWLAGHRPNPFRFLARTSVFVLPSLWEGASNALIEALVCGCRIVSTTRACGSREILADGRFGELVDPYDTQGIADAILRQLDMAERPVDCDSWINQFDLDQVLTRYVREIEAA